MVLTSLTRPTLLLGLAMLPDGVDLVLADFTIGLPPVVREWFLYSQDPKAVEQRHKVRMLAANHIDQANKRQAKRFEGMKREKELLDPKSPIRPIASIDPVIAQDFRNRFGSACLNDREFLEDCRKTAPELFFPK